MTPDQYCKQKTFKSGSSFYYSFLFLEENKKKAIMALYAFCREVDDITDNGLSNEIAYTKIIWWKKEIINLYKNNPSHPITKALLPHLKSFNLDNFNVEIISICKKCND